MIYNDGSTSTLYYYVLNAQGDVIALLNANGTLAASYNYGAWGNYSVHGADGKKTTDASFIGHINPLRYRGYYYDRETRLYYLQSRYYDFANCRFINNVPNSMLSQLYTGGVDTSIFRSGTLQYMVISLMHLIRRLVERLGLFHRRGTTLISNRTSK